ncbi:MAG: SDR family NAD(P)-dependent oxidoreductase, partial [Actinobacteria bacterium]|nr:SDR family NAD(P)-dependent oxidoreductase [Actinomycetota bacterium]
MAERRGGRVQGGRRAWLRSGSDVDGEAGDGARGRAARPKHGRHAEVLPGGGDALHPLPASRRPVGSGGRAGRCRHPRRQPVTGTEPRVAEAARAPDLASLFRLDGKTALVVGGYGGIGEVTTELLAQAGAGVAIAGRSFEKAGALAARLRDAGHRTAAGRVDLADRESIE